MNLNTKENCIASLSASLTRTASRGPSDGTESYLRNMPTGMLTVSRTDGTLLIAS
jgi:hypothetical protein